MRLQQSGFSGFGYSPSASTTASGSDSGGPSQATARKVLLGSVWSALGLSGPTGGVQDIASALSSALSTGLASGQDLAPQLTQTIDNALDQVSQRLEAQGVSPGHVAKLVAKFRQDLADAVSNAAATAGASSATNIASAGNPTVSSLAEFASIRESETLTIQTTDGAQVTLRLRAQAAELGASQTQADGSTTSAAALFASSKFQVEVSGNLSSADMTAINNIVSQVDSLATQFFSGDVQDAFAAAASIGADPSEIAGFSLQMSYSATVDQQASGTAAPSVAVPPVVTSTTGSGASATNTAANAGGTTSTTAAGSGATSAGATAAGTAANGTGASTTTAATSATPQQIMANFLQNALAKLSVAANGSGTALSGRWGIQLLAVALPAYAPSQTAAAAGSQAGNNPGQSSGNSTPAVTQVAIPSQAGDTTATQAAHLAAATLVQLVN